MSFVQHVKAVLRTATQNQAEQTLAHVFNLSYSFRVLASLSFSLELAATSGGRTYSHALSPMNPSSALIDAEEAPKIVS